jgi:hypothetical protein
MQKIEINKLYYSIEETRKILFDNKVSYAAMRNQIISGNIPALKVGSKFFIPAKWLQEKVDEAIK